MGIDVGGKKGVMADMNVVPLIDILLVLLIIFMVITPTSPKGLEAQIPQPAPRVHPPPPQAVVVVQVLEDGRLKINQESASWGDLGSRLSEIFKLRAQKVAFIRADDCVQFAEVARTVDIMRSSGIDKVGLLTGNLGPGRTGSP